MERVDAIVVGGGVVGLAIARSLALSGRQALILEAEAHFGASTSSRNSEVVHAGLYYPAGSLKAALCVEGRDQLYAFCQAHGVAYKRLGKLICAQDANGGRALDAIVCAAQAAGVDNLERVGPADARRLEPELDVAEALYSPSTGIVDSHAFMLALLGEAEALGATLVCNTKVAVAERDAGAWRVWIEGMAEPVVETPVLINAAGLGAQALAQRIEGLAERHIPKLHLARGVYFTYAGRTPFSHLIYPIPEPGGLGAHLTLDMAGQARFGPDVEWIDRVDYAIDPHRREAFVTAARRIWAKLDEDRLLPGYAGIRPKLSGPGEPAADFVISDAAEHGLDGLINLFGIESPGLTASLAIASRVAASLN